MSQTQPRRAAEPIRRRVDDELLTAQELADYLKIPLATIYKLRQEGTGVPGLRIGKHLRSRRSDVEMWLESKNAAA
jgi:excisionase family DNA binding protein